MAAGFNNSRPLDFIDSFLDKSFKSELPCNDVLRKLSERLRVDILASNSFQLPSLNVKKYEHLKPFDLVRFRCMIQDMREPEIMPIFVQRGSDKKWCLFRDYAECPDEFEFSAENPVIDRHVFRCVPIPSETAWVKQMWHELEENYGISIGQKNSNLTAPSGKLFKRNLDVDSEMDFDASENAASLQKRLNTNDGVVTREKSGNFQEDSCIVKVYIDGDSFKLNDCVEFTGIWNCIELDSSMHCSLHAIDAKVLPHIHPKLLNALEAFRPAENFSSSDQAVHLRAVDYLQNFLFGDRLAAEYLLCLLISTVIHKEFMCIGKFTLNLYNVPLNEFVPNLKSALCRIVSKVHYLPLSLALLNNERFVPYKNYETDQLCTGRLQLAAGTLLIIDETRLEAGQLNEQGVRNIAALKRLISHQKVEYDFLYHNVEFKTDLNVLILSEGPSCLSSDYALPLCKFVSPLFSDEVDSQRMDEFRSYLIRARKIQLEIDEKMQDKIRDDFVEMRRKSVDVDQTKLHELLVLSRWLTCGSGAIMLTEECWQRAKSMELERNCRKNREKN